ncbi:MAG: FMN-binding protein [Halieaceae bacterium]|jgi:electron transport complex protein RnfG|nr:FMN-binding protein [Halieaceae bacterium]
MRSAHGHANAAHPPIWPLYRALVGVGLVCGLLIVSVFVLTGPVIARNEAAALQQAVFKVLPGAVARASFTLGPDGSFHPAGEGDAPPKTVHAGYDAGGRLVGVAIEAQGMGYQDTIRVLYGYAPQSQAIVGMAVLSSKETPGLGDKIEKDPAFLANFQALDVSLAADGESLQRAVEAVKSGSKTLPSQIDGITGATISSQAIAAILRQSSAQWVPLVYRLQGELESEPAAERKGEGETDGGR